MKSGLMKTKLQPFIWLAFYIAAALVLMPVLAVVGVVL